MNIGERINTLQAQANQLAIQESNIREQLSDLRGLENDLETVLRLKNRAIGAIEGLRAMEAEQKPEAE
jgi:hypothetical protein